MKKVLAAGRKHVTMTAVQLIAALVVTLNTSTYAEVEVAAVFGLLWFAMIAVGEAASFVGRSTSWEASRLVPGYTRKIWTTSLYIAGVYVVLGTFLSFVIGHVTPPIGLASMVVIGLLVLILHSRRTGSRLLYGALAVVVFVFLGIPLSLLFDIPDIHSLIVAGLSSSVVQLVAFVVAVVAAFILRNEIDRIGYPSSAVNIEAWERFHPNVAGRFRFFGWMHPSANMLYVFLAIIPFFVIVGTSHAAFADEGSLLLKNSDSLKSVIAATCIYLGTGTAFGLLKNPGMWLAKAWQFGIGTSRNSLGSEFALNIVKACAVPYVFVFVVALVHQQYITAPSINWTGYANLYDEALLLITLNLLCFTWACRAYPKRTTECPEFLYIRLGMCGVTCLIFVFGIDFGFIGRILLLTALSCSALISVYIGGRLIAAIDFLSVKKEVNLFTK